VEKKESTPRKKQSPSCRRQRAAAFLAVAFVFGFSASAVAETFSLEQTIQTALEENLDLKIAREETHAAEYTRKTRLTEFFPTFSANYEYTYHDEERRSLGFLTQPQDETTLSATISQPLFTGLSITNQYRIAELGSELAQFQQQTARRDIVFAARNAYFSILKAEKIVVVAEQAVEQLTANHKVARDFYQVGMIPYNDLLKAEVELANARQDRIVAGNRLKIAQTDFNNLLRRPINASVTLVDMQDYSTLELDLETCLETAKKERKELAVGDLQVQIAEREVELTQSSYFPIITLEGTYFRNESGYAVGSGDPVGFIDDPDGWDISAIATWELFKWGKTNSSVREKLSRLSQAEYRRSQVGDAIEQEVKEAYLRTQDSESNIRAVEKAVEQAKENFRITEQRYAEQMATTTDVLDAQTLLSRTLTNYYNALYDFKISKASLYRAMGLEEMP
jgi:outer membrane protein